MRTMKFKSKTIVCQVCGKPFKSMVGPRIKTCSIKCHRKRRSEYISMNNRKDFEHVIRNLIKQSRFRAGRYKMSYDITYEYLWDLFEKQGRKCAITKIQFEISSGKGIKKRSPWSISIDRIDSSKGYIVGNVQLVIVIYNLCKNSWTHKDVVTFANSIKKSKS